MSHSLSQNADLLPVLERIAKALEARQGTSAPLIPDWSENKSYVWQAQTSTIKPVINERVVPLKLLVGIDEHAETLMRNTLQFATGYSANNALLWGARGMGKSALVKAVHREIANERSLILIEIHREDLKTLPILLHALGKESAQSFILFCDELSFDENDSSYKPLKNLLEGGVEGRPDNVLFYATSNRRHLMPRQMIENERSTAIHPSEAVEEKISLSDRFGLWLGFYPCDQDDYLEMVSRYAEAYKIRIDPEILFAEAVEWSVTRGNRSGRTAWQFIKDLAGREKVDLYS